MKVEITAKQLEYLESNRGAKILRCWQLLSDIHLQASSDKCLDIRYMSGIKPSLLTSELIRKEGSSLLAKACQTCPVMAQAIAKIPSLQ